ncbi:MAG TPA: hypothetical protein VFX96_03925 [Pyrinomonadaceae bacterium]|nr:hypothetical protein [Pyrinomonadaceae bacterium]
MTKQARPSAAALLLFALALQTLAQTTPPKQPQKTPAKTTPATAPAEVDPLAEIRRTTAISLVTSLADEARDFSSPVLRARVQARAADVLWETDTERARSLFRRAWDAAESADEAQEQRQEEEKKRQIAERGYFSIRNGPSLRSEVVRLAAKRDRALGEEFLTRLDEAAKETAERNEAALKDAERQQAATNAARERETPAAIRQRLGLARQLLEDGDVERAIQFADPALGATNMEAVDFLSRLRPHNATAADERYTALVARAASDPASDANTVSILSSYLFTPSFYITFSPTAGADSNRFNSTLLPPSDAPARLRAAFFASAATVLLRPSPPPDQDRSTSGRAGTYLVIARLLPLFEQHAPASAPALRQKLASLVPDTPEDARDARRNSALTRGLVPEDPNRDRVQESLERLKTAKDSAERDAVYSDAVFDAVAKNDPRAAELIDKIEDLDLKKQLRNYLDFETLDDAVRERKDVSEILRLARAGELTSVQRAWALTEAARLLAKAEPGRALEILDEAATEARKIDAASPERVRALVAVATQYAALDRPRMWELMLEFVKASNAVSEFTGEDAFILVNLRTKFSTNVRSTSVESFNIANLFDALAREDLDRAVDLARGLKHEHPRAAATLAIARAVLAPKGEEKARRADAR